MRFLHVRAPMEAAPRVRQLAGGHDAAAQSELKSADGRSTVLVLSLPNEKVGSFVREMTDAVEEAEIVLFPTGILPLRTPIQKLRDQVRDVSRLSTLELVLAAFQSIGSWRGMLQYAFFSGVIAAYGVIFNSGFLLVAAMLIAPMGAPALVAVVGMAIGDWRMLSRGALRFFAAVAVLVASAAMLGFAYALTASTAIMEQITSLSAWTALVALMAGAAGAQSQVESNRTSLVTGTATGFLVAAALSPTSAVLGLSLVLQRWDYTALMAFQLVLQFLTIALGGWLALLMYGVKPEEQTLGRGSWRGRWAMGTVTVLAISAMLVWQLRQRPTFLKADLVRDAVRISSSAVSGVAGTRLVETNAHFTRPDLTAGSRETLLIRLVVEQTGGESSGSELESSIRDAVRAGVRSSHPGVIPLVDVTVIPGAGGDVAP